MESGTNKRIIFAREYFAKSCENATNIYMKVYECTNKATAKANASRLLKHPEVIAELAKMQELSKKVLTEELNLVKGAIEHIDSKKSNLHNSGIVSNALNGEIDKQIVYIDNQVNHLKANEERLSFLLDSNNRKKMLADIAHYNNEETEVTTESGNVVKKRRNNKLVINAIDILNKMEGQYSDGNVNINLTFESFKQQIIDVTNSDEVI